MKVVILTTVPHGLASRCLPELCAAPELEVAAVILAAQHSVAKRKTLRRKLAKIWRIGPLGALNGIRMRSWFADTTARHIRDVARELGVPIIEVPAINTDETRVALRQISPDLAVSLGNSYIAESVFSIPRFGTINVHMELLPEYQGALSVLWPLHDGKTVSGVTVHRIDRGIDTGEILIRHEVPILFGESLGETVTRTVRRLRNEVPALVREACVQYATLLPAATRQSRGRAYTTPTMREYWRMARQHHRMSRNWSNRNQASGGRRARTE